MRQRDDPCRDRLQTIAGAIESRLEAALNVGEVYFVVIGDPYGEPHCLRAFTNAAPETVDLILYRLNTAVGPEITPVSRSRGRPGTVPKRRGGRRGQTGIRVS